MNSATKRADAIDPDVQLLLDKLPPQFSDYGEAVTQAELGGRQVMDIVIREGFKPYLRFTDGKTKLISRKLTTAADIADIAKPLFGGEQQVGPQHRAAIERSLHRVGVMCNTGGAMYGFTIRVGRDYPESYLILDDILKSRIIAPADPSPGRGRESLLLIGPPKRGKTTKLRGSARAIAETGLVVVYVDKSSSRVG